MYHHVAYDMKAFCVHPDRFRQQLEWLRKSGYQTISSAQFHSYRMGKWKPAIPSVVLTFDDGWLDNWCYVLPLLQEFQMCAIFFIVTSWPSDGPPRYELVGGRQWHPPSHWDAMSLVATTDRDNVVMRWSELRAAVETGLVEVHSHSHSHGNEWQAAHVIFKDKLHQDLLLSRKILEQRLGVESNQFCWPRGEFTNTGLDVAKQLGFTDQYSTLRGANRFGKQHLLVRRLHVEDREIAWFARRIQFYSTALSSDIVGWIHQQQYQGQMLRKHGLRCSEFDSIGAMLTIR